LERPLHRRRVMAAVDPEPGDPLPRALRAVEAGCAWGAGAKIGWPFILEYGLPGVARARDACGDGLLIADLKLADIGHVMRLAAGRLAGMVDAVIAHAFPGARGALLELKQALDGEGVGLVLVAAMSHPGALEVMEPCMDRLLDVIVRVKPWGIVAPATRPETIARLRERLPDTVILSPGVGAQGARPGDAVCAGADIEIVGRLVYRAPDPAAKVRELERLVEERCGAAEPEGKNRG